VRILLKGGNPFLEAGLDQAGGMGIVGSDIEENFPKVFARLW
jgi:hypothetical protein